MKGLHRLFSEWNVWRRIDHLKPTAHQGIHCYYSHLESEQQLSRAYYHCMQMYCKSITLIIDKFDRFNLFVEVTTDFDPLNLKMMSLYFLRRFDPLSIPFVSERHIQTDPNGHMKWPRHFQLAMNSTENAISGNISTRRRVIRLFAAGLPTESYLLMTSWAKNSFGRSSNATPRSSTSPGWKGFVRPTLRNGRISSISITHGNKLTLNKCGQSSNAYRWSIDAKLQIPCSENLLVTNLPRFTFAWLNNFT